jgi:hypothetical protein
MAVDPAMSDPVLTSTGRLLVVAGRPDIMVAFVAVIADLLDGVVRSQWIFLAGSKDVAQALDLGAHAA